MTKKIYRGEPGGVVKVIEFGLSAQTTPSGKSRLLLTRANCAAIRLSETVRAKLALVSPCTSPTGFGRKRSDGYGGSGPADLALSILCDVLGERPSEKQIYHGRFKAYPHHQDFKREFVARWEFGGGFEIDSGPIGQAWGTVRRKHSQCQRVGILSSQAGRPVGWAGGRLVQSCFTPSAFCCLLYSNRRGWVSAQR